MVKARKYVVKQHFFGAPKRSDFEVLEEELPMLRAGEYLVKAQYISVDPYMRSYNARQQTPYHQFGFQVGVVIESKNAKFPEGSRVVSHEGWRDYTVLGSGRPAPFGVEPYSLPDLEGLPPSFAVGALGMPGATAFFGLLEICKPQAGDTVVVTSAAGAVGSLVGQIARIIGCEVIGFAGSEEKAQWLVEELGFTHAYNYRTVNVTDVLKEIAPQGIDCYFDNVGGEMSAAIISAVRERGRVALVGAVSLYGDDTAPEPVYRVERSSVKIKPFSVWEWTPYWRQAFAQIAQWIERGDLKVREHVTDGFPKTYDAFAGMLRGENFGKAIVKV